MKNVTRIASQLNASGTRDCLRWGCGPFSLVRLENGNGRVTWSAQVVILGRSFMVGTAGGGQ